MPLLDLWILLHNWQMMRLLSRNKVEPQDYLKNAAEIYNIDILYIIII